MDPPYDSLVDYSSRYEQICQRLARSLSEDNLKSLKFVLRKTINEDDLKQIHDGHELVQLLERNDIMSEQKLHHVRSLLRNAGVESVDEVIQSDAAVPCKGLSKQDVYDLRSMNVVGNFKETVLLKKMVDIVDTKRAVLVQGPNGSGKSQSAFWYARKFHKQNPKSVVWRIHCKSERSVYLSFATLMSHLKIECILSDSTTCDCIYAMLDLTVRNLTNEKNYHLKHLVVMDDIESPEDPLVRSAMEQFIAAENVYVVATSNKRYSRDLNDLYGLKMDKMTESEAISLFSFTSSREEEEVKNLARNLDYLPLALSLAASYVNITHISVYDYNRNLLDSQLQADALERRSLEQSYSITLQRLDDDITNSARRVLSLVPYLNHNNISVILLKSFLPEELSSSERELEINKLLLALTDYSLATVEGVGESRFISMHGVSCLMIENAKTVKRLKQDVNFLLRHYCYNLDTDARLVESMTKNVCFIHHAVLLLKKYSEYFDNTLFETKVYEIYLCCAIGITFRLYGSTELTADDYFSRAKTILFGDILLMSLPEKALHTGNVSSLDDYLYGSLVEQEETRQIYLKLLEISKECVSIPFIEQFLTMKVRSSREIELFKHYGRINPKELRNNRLPSRVVKAMIIDDLIAPMSVIKDTFLIDLLITIMNNSSKNKWWMEISKECGNRIRRHAQQTDSLTEFRFAHNLAQYLNMYFHETCPSCIPLASTSTKRNGILSFLRSNEKIASSELKDVILKLDEMYNKSASCYYLSYGVLKMAPKFNLHHRCLITRMLVKCYVKLWENDHDQNDLFEALFQADKLAGLANEMSDWLVLTSMYFEAAQTYMLDPRPENLQHAKHNYKMACQKAKEGGNIINTNYHLNLYQKYIDFCLKYGNTEDLADAEQICLEMLNRFIKTETKLKIQKQLDKVKQKIRTPVCPSSLENLMASVLSIWIYIVVVAAMIFSLIFSFWLLNSETNEGDL